jgi:hypothetical protein
MNMKKHALYGILAAVSLLALGITQSAKANLVVNGGFETGDFTGWTQGGNLGFTGVSGTFGGQAPHGGNFQAFLGPIGSDGTLTQNLATTGGGFYTLDYWLYLFPGTPNDFAVKWGGATIAGSVLTNSGPFGYTEYTFNVFTSTNITALEFDFRDDPSYFLLDDISVNAGVPDSGSTVVLLGAAMIVVGLVHRRLAAKRA